MLQVVFPLPKKITKTKKNQKQKNTNKHKTVHLDCIVDRHVFVPSLLQELILFSFFFLFFLCVCFSLGSEFSLGLLHQGTFYVEAYPQHLCNLLRNKSRVLCKWSHKFAEISKSGYEFNLPEKILIISVYAEFVHQSRRS